MAVMHAPSLLIADEPTSALDAMTQVEILNMLATLNRDTGTAILYISHDLQSVASLCQPIAILHEGAIVECGTTEAVLLHPRHSYTQRLVACAPWLPWWMKGTQRSKCQARSSAKGEDAAANVRTASEQSCGRIKSPCHGPMG